MPGQDSKTGGVLFFNMDLMLNKHSIFITFPLGPSILMTSGFVLTTTPESYNKLNKTTKKR